MYLVSNGVFAVSVYLKVEDAGVLSVLKVLSVRDDSSQNLFVEGQRGDGGEQPAVTCRDRQGAGLSDTRLTNQKH